MYISTLSQLASSIIMFAVGFVFLKLVRRHFGFLPSSPKKLLTTGAVALMTLSALELVTLFMMLGGHAFIPATPHVFMTTAILQVVSDIVAYGTLSLGLFMMWKI